MKYLKLIGVGIFSFSLMFYGVSYASDQTDKKTGYEKALGILEHAEHLSQEKRMALRELPSTIISEYTDHRKYKIRVDARVTPEGRISIVEDTNGYHERSMNFSADEAKKLMIFLKELFEKQQ